MSKDDNRDDFSHATIRKMRELVNYRCSYPGCTTATYGRLPGSDKIKFVGTAAHITAAAPGKGAKRYDAKLLPEQRADVSNGMWCCAHHGRLIDTDEKTFTVDILKSWKKSAEDRATRELLIPNARPELGVVGEELTDEEQNQIAILGLPQPQDAFVNGAESARRDLAALKKQLPWSDSPVHLDLRMHGYDVPATFDAAGLATAMQSFSDVIVRAAPGTGKTTTLIQVVDAILKENIRTAAFIALNEWSALSESFFSNLLRRNAYQHLTPKHLSYLAIHGRLVLVLDGWNELDGDSRKRATAQINELRRDYPRIAFLISTRRQAVDVPISGRDVEIQSLTQKKQLEIAKALKVPTPEKVLKEAWQRSGIRQLVSIPLYLWAWLQTTADGTYPTTKEEVIRRFVTQHDEKPERKAALREKLFGCHPTYLVNLAIEATRAGNTSISDANARASVASTTKMLEKDGVITITIDVQPQNVLDTLVAQHALVRPNATSATVEFQHQQIEEWYASHKVEAALRDSAKGNKHALRFLREEALNLLTWEESVLFACERASRHDKDGVEAVALAINETLGIDPMLAASMLRSGTADVWPYISKHVLQFAENWNKTDQASRAFAFMIGSGRPEFADAIWNVIADRDAFNKSARYSRRGVSIAALGADALDRYRALPAQNKRSFLWDVARYGGPEGRDWVVTALKDETDTAIINSIADLLYHGHGHDAFEKIVASMSAEAWEAFADKIPVEETEGDLRRRVIEAKRKLADNTKDGGQKLRHLMQLMKVGAYDDMDALINLALDTKHKDFHADRNVVEEIAPLDPSKFSAAVCDRVLKGQALPISAGEHLSTVAPREHQPALLQIATSGNRAPPSGAVAAARLLDQESIAALFAELFPLQNLFDGGRGNLNDAQRKRYDAIEDALKATNCEALCAAIFANDTHSPIEIAELAQALYRWRDADRDESGLSISDETRERLCTKIEQWTNDFIGHAADRRQYLHEIATAIKKLASLSLLPQIKRLLDEELKLWQEELDEIAAAFAAKRVPKRYNHSYTNMYRAAFEVLNDSSVRDVLLGYIGNPLFEVEAAFTLRKYATERALDDGNSFGGPRYHNVVSVRKDRAARPRPLSVVAKIILDRIDALVATGEKEDLGRAISMATAVVQMDYGDRIATIQSALNAPGPYLIRGFGQGKFGLASVMTLEGEPISGDFVKRAFDDALEAILKDKSSQQNSWYLVGQWLDLLPFTDKPELILDCIAAIPNAFRRPHHFDSVINSLGHSQSDAATEILAEIAAKFPEIVSAHDFVNTLARIGTAKEAGQLMEYAFDMNFVGKLKHGQMSFATPLISLLNNHPEVRAEFMKKVQDRKVLEASQISVHVLNGIMKEEEVMGFIVAYNAQGGDRISEVIHSAVGRLATIHRPVQGNPNAYSIEPVDLGKLRADLFKLRIESGPSAMFAESLLIEIDNQRDMYGRVLSEPRHPDISTGVAWPTIRGAGQPYA